MRLSDFDFCLPAELIAQAPSRERDQSALILPGWENRIIKFAEIINYLDAGDLLVFNDSRVINASLALEKAGKKINVNLNKPSFKAHRWRAFARPAKKLSIGDKFIFENHTLVITDKFELGEVEIGFDLDGLDIFTFLEKYGNIPLPSYIKRGMLITDDAIRYQTVYSRVKGSVAAPTAGLHFSDQLLRRIREKNIEIRFVTLHVGAGTFLPVKTENILEHKMHSEYCEVTEETAEAINKAKKENRRIISVGTTALRTLETFAKNEKIVSGVKETNIFIVPGYKFQIADILITNFHLPKSTLFMLVCAFSGVKEMKNLYDYAISKKMRFFSYGDAMMIHRKEVR